jgi:hypothetical protein
MTLRVPTSFGEDACGHIYVTSLDGSVYRIQDGPVSTCAAATDFTAPRLRVSLGGVRHAARKRRLLVRARCTEACRIVVATRLEHVPAPSAVSRKGAGRRRVTIRVRLGKPTAARLRQRLATHGSVRVRVVVRAVDAAGNVRTVHRSGHVEA